MKAEKMEQQMVEARVNWKVRRWECRLERERAVHLVRKKVAHSDQVKVETKERLLDVMMVKWKANLMVQIRVGLTAAW